MKPEEDDVARGLFTIPGAIVSVLQLLFLLAPWIGSSNLSTEIETSGNVFNDLRNGGCIYDNTYVWAIDNYDSFLTGLGMNLAYDANVIGLIFLARIFVAAILLVWKDRDYLKTYVPFLDNQQEL
jgi:hypothetical protein